MEADKKFTETSQLETIAPWANKPFTTMASSTLPLAPTSLSRLWKRPYSMNHFENGESSGGAKSTHIQSLNIYNTTTFMIPTPNFIVTPTTTNNPTPPITATATTTPSPTLTPSAITTPLKPTLTSSTTTTPAIEVIKDKGQNPKEESESDTDSSNDDSKIVTAVKSVKEEKDYGPVGALQIRVGHNVYPESLDPRRLRRILSNRLSAQKSRLKRIKYVAGMEKKAKELKEKIAALSPQIESYKDHNYLLQMEQNSLHESIAAYTADQIHKDALIEANKKEIQRLRLVHQEKLEQQKMQLQARMFMDNPGLTQYQLGNMLCSSDSTLEQRGENATESYFQTLVREAVEQHSDLNPSFGAGAGGNKEMRLHINNLHDRSQEPEPC